MSKSKTPSPAEYSQTAHALGDGFAAGNCRPQFFETAVQLADCPTPILAKNMSLFSNAQTDSLKKILLRVPSNLFVARSTVPSTLRWIGENINIIASGNAGPLKITLSASTDYDYVDNGLPFIVVFRSMDDNSPIGIITISPSKVRSQIWIQATLDQFLTMKMTGGIMTPNLM